VQQKGKLVVWVFATGAQLPLEGATVVVTTRSESGKFNLISIQKTDRSGLTRPIEIDTPDGADSTQFDPTGQQPFVSCDVWAEHPGFAVMRVEGVQIFPGVVTRQDMELLPLAAGDSDLGSVDRRDITAQNL